MGSKRAGVKVLSISTLTHNWVVKYVSDRLVSTLDEFERLLASGDLDEYFK